MRDQLKALYRLQRIDARITEAQVKLAALDGARELKKRYVAAKARLEQAEKTLHEQETELMDIELKLKSVDEKRVKFEKRLYSGEITNPKELSAVEKEIAMLKQQQGKLDTTTLGLYDSVESARAAAQDARNAFGEAESRLKDALGKESAEKKRLEAELVDLAAQRESAASGISDKRLLARYDSIRRKTGDTAVARITGNQCEGCRVAVTPGVLRMLAGSDEIISCESCGRLLLLDSEENE